MQAFVARDEKKSAWPLNLLANFCAEIIRIEHNLREIWRKLLALTHRPPNIGIAVNCRSCFSQSLRRTRIKLIKIPVGAIVFTALISAGLPLSPAGAEGIQLSLPLDCVPGKTCFVQQYVDVKAGPGAEDYACGRATYDGHKGTDFRLPTLAEARKGVAVLKGLI